MMEDRLDSPLNGTEERPKSIFTFFKDEWKGDLLSFKQFTFGEANSISQAAGGEDNEEWEREVLQQLSFIPKITRKNSFTIRTTERERTEYLGRKRKLSEFNARSMIDIGEERLFKESCLNSKLKQSFKDPLNDSIDKAIAQSSSLSNEPSYKRVKKQSQCLMSFKRIRRRKSMFGDNIMALFK